MAQFMVSFSKATFQPVGYYINGRRVQREIYEYFEASVGMYGTFDRYLTTSTPKTIQFRKSGGFPTDCGHIPESWAYLGEGNQEMSC